LTGSEQSIRRLTESVGFRYAWDQQTGQYAHAAGIVVLTPEGKISRYFYGVEYPPRDLRLGLVEASANKIGSATDRVLLFCYQYDPTTGKYGLVIMRAIRLGGLATVLGLISYIGIMIRRERRRPKQEPS
jgi:protein SCO1/2